MKLIIVIAVAFEGIIGASIRNLTQSEAGRLKAWTESDKQQMWELSGQMEGDMVLVPAQRNGLFGYYHLWNKNVIPYEIDPIFTSSQAAIIHEAVKEISEKSCVSVRPKRMFDRDYVYVTGMNNGCYSNLGYLGGKQLLNLQPNGCLHKRVIVHEFLHAAGFFHQQSASDRDSYIDIMWHNIEYGMEGNFVKYDSPYTTSFGQKYDYGSIMHYSGYAFSKNGEKTIIPKDHNAVIGEATEMSKIDAIKLNRMYNCFKCIGILKLLFPRLCY